MQYLHAMLQKHLFLGLLGIIMSSIEKTAYPRFPKRRKIKPVELNRNYSLQPAEVNMINLAANKDKLRLSMAIQLKTFQRLGYFADMNDIPVMSDSP
jgi:hypothetical protein